MSRVREADTCNVNQDDNESVHALCRMIAEKNEKLRKDVMYLKFLYYFNLMLMINVMFVK